MLLINKELLGMSKITNKTGVVIIIIVVIALVISGGLFIVVNNKSKNADTTTNAQSNDSASTASTTNTTKQTTNELKEFCATDEKACFSYPTDWVQSNASEYYDSELNNTAVLLTSPNGTKLLYHSGVTGIGGNCEPTSDNVITYDSVTASSSTPSLKVVEAHIGQAATPTDIGLSSNSSITVGKTDECLLYFVFSSQTNPEYGVSFGTRDHSYNQKDAQAIKAILNSYHYH